MDPMLLIVLAAILFGLLGSGVWVAFALIAVGFAGLEFFTSSPSGPLAVTSIWTATKQLGRHCTTSVHLDGRDSAPHAVGQRHVRGPGSMADSAAGTSVAREHPGLRHLRRCVGVFGGNSGDHRQDYRAGTTETPI